VLRQYSPKREAEGMVMQTPSWWSRRSFDRPTSRIIFHLQFKDVTHHKVRAASTHRSAAASCQHLTECPSWSAVEPLRGQSKVACRYHFRSMAQLNG
jgi:hypothetical protein